ncbi:hypothetical protein BGZ58_006375 [Dissophora ornata]|nr:hypothetical protein BGZ58_006375 [Dissophora ornata]
MQQSPSATSRDSSRPNKPRFLTTSQPLNSHSGTPRFHLYGGPLQINKTEAPLVEASVGRIFHFGGETTTVLDELFVLCAAVNYFRMQDSDFYSAICNLFKTPSVSVHGFTWEIAILISLVHVFHGKDSLVSEVKSYDAILDRTAKIAGINGALTLGIDFESMSLGEFLEAHVDNDSHKTGKSAPPVYFPKATPSGSDIAFVLDFDKHGYCPVYIQVKLRTHMS